MLYNRNEVFMKRFLTGLWISVFFLGNMTVLPVQAVNTTESIRVVFTQNLNARLDEQLKTDENDEVVSYGGFAYIADAAEQYTGSHSLLVDAGNFAYGSFFSYLNNTSAPALSLLNAMEYDAVALGNREFENGAGPLSEMLEKVSSSPALLADNVELADTTDAKQLENAVNKLGGMDAVVINKRGVKFGVFSVIADKCDEINSEDIHIGDTIRAANEAIHSLQSQNADIIICLYQGGMTEDAVKLAEKTNGIDLMISAEKYKYDDVIEAGGTHIVSAGSNGEYIGVVDFDDNHEFKSFSLVEVSHTKFTADPFIRGKVETDIGSLNSRFLNRYNYNFSKTFANSAFSTSDVTLNPGELTGNNTGNLITDAYAREYQRLNPQVYPVIGITDKSMVTGRIIRGNITVPDLFEICGNGIAEDGTVGTPLVQVYLTGKDLVSLAEMDCSIFRSQPERQLLFSHMRYVYSDNRQNMNRVEDVLVEMAKGYFIPVENEQLYAVVMNESTAEMIQREAEKAGSLIHISYRNEEGVLIADLPTHYVKNENRKVVCEWMAVAEYISDMERTNANVPSLDSAYESSRKARIATTEVNLSRYFKHINSATIHHYLRIGAFIVLGAAGIRILIWLLNRRKETGEK